MKNFFRVAGVTLGLVMTFGSANAVDLLGDTLSFRRGFPNISTQFGQAIPDTTVAAGTSDQVNWRFSVGGLVLTTINPEADRIVFSFPISASFVGTPTSFDGFVVFAFDNDISSTSLISNNTGMSVTLGGNARQMTVNLNGTSPANTSFAVAVTAVPEPAAAALMLMGIVALGGMVKARARRR